MILGTARKGHEKGGVAIKQEKTGKLTLVGKIH